MDQPAGTSRFAAALEEALSRRRLPLARVQARLAAVGLPVAVSTLSQWQHGHRVPRSPRSLAVVDELERILAVPAGSLRQLVDEADDRPVPGRPVVSYAEAYDNLLEQLGMQATPPLEILGAHDRILLDHRGSLVSRRTTMALRMTAATDRQAIAHGVDPGGDVDLVRITAIAGCRLGRVVRDRAAGVVVAELHFDRRLSAGETVVHEVEIEDGNDALAHDYFRWSLSEIPLLVLEVTFDRRLVPTTVHEFARRRSDAPDAETRELSLAGGDHVHVVHQPAAAGVHGIRWSWPEHRAAGGG
ncbi:hypothetical protein [Arsenicicoccus sp. oral taxon 190]|uniref:hypothetical protein n=1 Tax=Arsenicicoccus sp. oral taxon 190 TaxID=1658671 RepID=UPI00067B213F|nr:hypothetical protein [Arsenicicoccus sp. oral taxon 190]